MRLFTRNGHDWTGLYPLIVEAALKLPLFMRKTNLARLVSRSPDGTFVAPFEQGEIGPDLRKACEFGLDGTGVQTSGPLL